MPQPIYVRTFALLAIATLLLGGCSLLPGGAKKSTAVAEIPPIGLELTGIDGAPADNIRAHLSVTSKPCTLPKPYLNVLRERARGEAVEALQAFGYYSSLVTVDINDEGDCPLVLINVVPGPPVVVTRSDIDIRGPGGSDPGFARRLAGMALKVGEPINHQHYTATRQLIETIALERGYLTGKFLTRKLKVDPAQHSAEITLVFDTGPRHTIGEINIDQGRLFLNEGLIRRFLEVSSGEPYTAGRVSEFNRSLAKGVYFKQIDVRPRLSTPVENTIPIDIKLTPRPRHKMSYGIGASTDEGIRGRATYENRRLNRYGHQLNVNANASFIEQEFSTAYLIPRKHPVDEWLTFQAGLKRRDVDTFNTVETQIAIVETKRRPWGWMETRFLELSREDFQVSGVDDTTTFLTPGVSWRKTSANDSLFPTRGYSVNLEFKGAAEAVLSDTNFVKTVLDLGSVYGLPFGSRAIFRGRFGAFWVDEFSRLPPSERFFAGGDNSIRGYDIDSRGPIDESGEVIGGIYLAALSAELEHYFTDKWGVAGFVDTGNAFGGDGSSTGLQTGIGIGLRWRSPVGPVRIDIAHPLDDASNDFRLHLRIGPDF